MSRIHVNFPEPQELIRGLGLERGGPAQKIIDTEIMRGCDPYVPKDKGDLQDSVWKNTDVGSGKLIWDIYGNENRNSWNDTVSVRQGAPMRGAFWALRFWDAGGRERIAKAVNAFLRGKE